MRTEQILGPQSDRVGLPGPISGRRCYTSAAELPPWLTGSENRHHRVRFSTRAAERTIGDGTPRPNCLDPRVRCGGEMPSCPEEDLWSFQTGKI